MDLLTIFQNSTEFTIPETVANDNRANKPQYATVQEHVPNYFSQNDINYTFGKHSEIDKSDEIIYKLNASIYADEVDFFRCVINIDGNKHFSEIPKNIITNYQLDTKIGSSFDIVYKSENGIIKVVFEKAEKIKPSELKKKLLNLLESEIKNG